MITPRTIVLVVVVATSLISACGDDSVTSAADDAPGASAPTMPRRVTALNSFRSPRSLPRVADPVWLRIPSLRVTTRLERLGMSRDHVVDVPRQPQDGGWFAGSPRPGQDGPAVILGHVDSRQGRAVFFRLHELRRGDKVDVERSDGTTVTFSVDRSARYRKARFPTASVYYPTLRPELRLITCGGIIDPRTGHYRDNLVVFASLP